MVFWFLFIRHDKGICFSWQKHNDYIFLSPSSLLLPWFFWSEAIPVETAKQNPNVALVLTSYGGHIGFLEGIWPRQSTYMDRVFKQFVQAMVEHGHELS